MIELGHGYRVFPIGKFTLLAAIVVTTLKVEAGAYRPWIARLISGALDSTDVSCLYSSLVTPSSQTRGS